MKSLACQSYCWLYVRSSLLDVFSSLILCLPTTKCSNLSLTEYGTDVHGYVGSSPLLLSILSIRPQRPKRKRKCSAVSTGGLSRDWQGWIVDRRLVRLAGCGERPTMKGAEKHDDEWHVCAVRSGSAYFYSGSCPLLWRGCRARTPWYILITSI